MMKTMGENEPFSFVTIPRTVKAMQLIGDNRSMNNVFEWLKQGGYPWLIGDASTPELLTPEFGEEGDPGIYIDPATGELVIRTPAGDLRAAYGDWIVQGVDGVFRPFTQDHFESTHKIEN